MKAKRVKRQGGHYPDEASLRHGDRVALGRAITLVESHATADRKKADMLIRRLAGASSHTIRIGITGAPGAGKSTFINVFGKHITSLGHKVAVLTVDPSSQKTRGSILGDKTRMEDLSKDPNAFIRPTAAGHTIGGVSGATREVIVLCEAAGYDVILVETVGVGQSEVTVRGMVDFFLLLIQPGSGDELQGIKKGIMELADGIVVTKSDGDNIGAARQTQADFKQALHLFQAPESGNRVNVLASSATLKTGVGETWNMIEAYRTHTHANQFFERQRSLQLLEWFHSTLDLLLKERMVKLAKGGLAVIEKKILSGRVFPRDAAFELIRKLK